MVAGMMFRGFVAAWIVVGVVSQSAPARADAAEVEALIAKGNELRRAGTPGPALPYFQKAYELARTPRTTGQLGLAELAAGYPVEAAQHLAAALKTPSDPSIVKYRKMLTDALATARAQIGELTIQGSPAGAEVVADGRVIGALPMASPVEVVARPTELVVRAPGYAPHTEQLQIAAGQRNALTIDLKKVETPAEPPPVVTPAAPPTAVPAPPEAPAPPTSTAAAVVDQGSGNARSSGSGLRTAAWIVGGGAVVAAGTGLVLNLVANSKSTTFDAGCGTSPDGPKPLPNSTVLPGECQDRYDTWQSYRTWSIVGYVSGAALAVTSGLLFWTSAATSASAGAHAGLNCAPTPTGLSCRGLF